jgi:hypothetical protein
MKTKSEVIDRIRKLNFALEETKKVALNHKLDATDRILDFKTQLATLQWVIED